MTTESLSSNTPVRAAPPRHVGETVASPQRPAQRMHGAALAFDLAREAAALRQESGWAQRDRNGKTLVHERGLRVVLVALKPRARIAEHDTRAHVTVHVVDGRLLAHLAGRTVEVPQDGLLSVAAGVPHELEALEDCAFVLTIAGAGSPAGGNPHAAAARAVQVWADDGGRG